MLKLTHFSTVRPGWTDEHGTDGVFVRFSGPDEPFHEMRNVLKSLSRLNARWTHAYSWPDGKYGAWWIDEDVFSVLADSFIRIDGG